MKTTLVIDDQVLLRLKQQAARQGRTLSQMAEMALRLMLDQSETVQKPLTPLPTFDGGGCLVDVKNREALYEAMDQP